MLVLENSNELRVAKDLVSEHYYFAYKSRSGLAGCLKNLMIHPTVFERTERHGKI